MAGLTGVLVTISVILVGTILTIVAVATPHWIVVDHEGEDVVLGLFEICYKALCLRLDSLDRVDIPDSIIACRGTNISAILLGGLAGFTSCLWLIKARVSSKKRSVLPSITLGASVLASILVVITLVVYGLEIYQPAEKLAKLGYSIFLNAIGAFLLLAGGIAFRLLAGMYLTSLPEPPIGQVLSMPNQTNALCFHNPQQLEQMNCQGLVYQQPQATVLQPPPAYTQYPEEQQNYVSHLNREPQGGQFTPGETRKAAPGSTSI